MRLTPVEKLKQMLREKGFEIDLLVPAEGAYRHMDCCRWDSFGNHDGRRISMCSWDTVTKCVKEGIVVKPVKEPNGRIIYSEYECFALSSVTPRSQ